MAGRLKNIFLEGVRKLGFSRSWDKLYYQFNRLRYRSKNKSFIQNHPGISLPPPYLLYESYRLDYESYFTDGRNTAFWIVEQLSPFKFLENAVILEWGCGPARIIRHLPALLPKASIHGCDYNTQTINWCTEHITGVQFSNNELQPPLPYAPAFFDVVYALSVLTHLSVKNHFSWMEELHRILRPGGLLLLTVQGKAFRDKLNSSEKKNFEQGLVVERNGVVEGHRSFSAFQPEAFMRKVFSKNWKILSWKEGSVQSWGPEQDVWIVERQ